MFDNDPIFSNVKIVTSLYEDKFTTPLRDELRKKIESEGVVDENISIIDNPSYENLYRFVIDYADGVVISSEKADAALVEYARQSGKPVLEYSTPEGAEFFDNYNRFYEEL